MLDQMSPLRFPQMWRQRSDNFGGSESLTVVLIFSPKNPSAFEVRPRGLLHSISVTSNVFLIFG